MFESGIPILELVDGMEGKMEMKLDNRTGKYLLKLGPNGREAENTSSIQNIGLAK